MSQDPPPYFSVGLHKGEMDFGVSGSVIDLSHEEMRRLREMIVVGIGVLEQTWRHANQPMPCQENLTPKSGEEGE